MAVVTLTFNGQRVKHSLLVGVGTHVEIGERDRRALAQRSTVVIAQRLLEFVAVDRSGS